MWPFRKKKLVVEEKRGLTMRAPLFPRRFDENEYFVMTALRGPDRPDVDCLKELLTIPIRRWAFGGSGPSYVGVASTSNYIIGGAIAEARDWMSGNRYSLHHYLSHIRLAAISVEDWNLSELSSLMMNGKWEEAERFALGNRDSLSPVSSL